MITIKLMNIIGLIVGCFASVPLFAMEMRALERPLPYHQMPVGSYEYGKPISVENYTLLMAAAHGDLDSITRMLQAGANITTSDDNDNTPLHFAAANGHLDAVRMLIANGADINWSNGLSQTPLHRAVANGHLFVVRELLSHRPNLNDIDFEGLAPLHHAVSRGNVEIARDLLIAGAHIHERTDPQTVDFPSFTPLQIAIHNDNRPLIRMLMWWGAGHTENERPAIIRALEKQPLMLASARGALGLVMQIVTQETTVDQLVEALMFALGQGHSNVVDFLASTIVERGGSTILQGYPLHHIHALLFGAAQPRNNLCDEIYSNGLYADYYTLYEILMSYIQTPRTPPAGVGTPLHSPTNQNLDPEMRHWFRNLNNHGSLH
jgi:hypothetical protein